jgi:hypothetical protein
MSSAGPSKNKQTTSTNSINIQFNKLSLNTSKPNAAKPKTAKPACTAQPKTICQICGKAGHSASICHHRNQGASVSVGNVNAKKNPSLPKIFPNGPRVVNVTNIKSQPRIQPLATGQVKFCFHCGESNHDFGSCRHKLSVCHICQQLGHLAKVCRGKNKQTPQTNTITININK